MIKLVLKGECVQLSQNFSSDELDCRCNRITCTHTTIDMDLVDALEEFRLLVGKPVAIRSGYRCPAHNADEGGKLHGKHPLGQAADLIVVGFTGIQLRNKALLVPRLKKGGIGIYARYPNMIHVDVRTDGPARWNY